MRHHVRICRAGAVLALLGMWALAPAGADSNVTYNFNSDNGIQNGWSQLNVEGIAPQWVWVLGASSTTGGWQALTGSNSANSAAYLTSPCFVLNANNQQELLFRVNHRYDFPFRPSGTTANQVGQIQYRVDTSGTGWGPWRGIPTAYFTTGTYPPNYGPPLFPPLIVSATITTGTMPVQAWAGTTDRFADGIHHRTDFTLPLPEFGLVNGNEIQFRFAMATELDVSGSATSIVWELNKVEVFGVYECPEPGTLALAGLGGLGGLVLARHRKRRRSGEAGRVAGSTAVTILVAAAIIGLLVATPASAQTSWNFELANGGWLRSGTTEPVPQTIPAAYRWMWTGTTGTIPVTGGTSPHWHVRAVPVQSPASAAVFLTSPVFSGLVSGSVPSVNARISIAHSYFYNTGASGRPIATGQLQYQINGSGTWVGLPLDAFTDGGSVTDPNIVFGFSPFRTGTSTFTLVDQSDYVAPSYLTPTGSAQLPIISGSAAAFLGATPSWPGDYYVPTEAFLNGDTGLTAGITSLQLRFTSLNLAGSCDFEDGWNVRFVQVDFSEVGPIVPEPAAIATGATGLAVLVAAGATRRRRRRHQRPSRPSDRP